MAEVVLVHGIAQEKKSASDLEMEWLPALCAGVRAAGDPVLADRIWYDDRHGPAEIRMAAYGDLFLRPGAQGAGDDLADLSPEGMVLAEGLAEEWLRRAADRSEHPDHATATREIRFVDHPHEAQGPAEEVGRAMINAVANVRWFAVGGMAFAERFVKKALIQVTRYFTEPALRDQIHDRVHSHLGPETKIIIGHSLGSVVAYEIAASDLTKPLPLLITLGSPLGLRTVVYDRLSPQPPTYPDQVERWVNISDRNDLVAAEPDLTNLFPANTVAVQGRLESGWTVHNGAKPHDAGFYLQQLQTGGPVAATLAQTGQKNQGN